jgi:hypothetical protein
MQVRNVTRVAQTHIDGAVALAGRKSADRNCSRQMGSSPRPGRSSSHCESVSCSLTAMCSSAS